MIDKVPETTETTTLQCELPKALVERLAEMAHQRSQTLDEAVGQAIDQSCERWEQEEVFGPAEVMYSAPDIPLKDWTPVEVKPGPPHLPDPPTIEDDLVEPFTLPLTNPQPIDVQPGPPHEPNFFDGE